MIWGAITDGHKGPILLWDKENWGNIIAVGFVEHIFLVSCYINFYFISFYIFFLIVLGLTQFLP